MVGTYDNNNDNARYADTHTGSKRQKLAANGSGLKGVPLLRLNPYWADYIAAANGKFSNCMALVARPLLFELVWRVRFGQP